MLLPASEPLLISTFEPAWPEPESEPAWSAPVPEPRFDPEFEPLPSFPAALEPSWIVAEPSEPATAWPEPRSLPLPLLAICEPGPLLRGHIHVYVDRERATLETPIERGSRVDVIAAISGG